GVAFLDGRLDGRRARCRPGDDGLAVGRVGQGGRELVEGKRGGFGGGAGDGILLEGKVEDGSDLPFLDGGRAGAGGAVHGECECNQEVNLLLRLVVWSKYRTGVPGEKSPGAAATHGAATVVYLPPARGR